MASIHPTAIVDPKAELADDVEIGPYSCVGPGVRLAAGVRLEAHVVVSGRTSIGEGTQVYPFACLGQRPQHLKYRGEDTALVIGRHNQIREHVTMHPGTAAGTGVTRVGDHGLFMAAIHVAHDCEVGDHVIMANNATLGGHVQIQDYVFLGGVCGIHQFVRIGRYAMVGGKAMVDDDVIPYGLVYGNRAALSGLNIIGLKRHNFSREEVQSLRSAYRLLFAPEGTFAERLDDVAAQYTDQPRVMEIVGFIRSASARGLCQPRHNSGRAG